MKGRILIVALLVLVMASVSFGQLFKFPITSGAGIGTVVDNSGAAISGVLDDGAIVGTPLGIVIEVASGEALVANSGLARVTGHGVTVGAMATYNATGGLVDWVPESGRPVVAIAVDANTIMITIKDDRADQTQYTFPDVALGEAGFLGIVDLNPNTVQEAIDEINDFLRDLAFTVSGWNEATDEAVAAAWAVLVDVTPAIPTGADAIAEGDDILVTFHGTFNDIGDVTGGHVQLQFFDGTTAIGEVHDIYMIDRDYHQTESFSMSWRGAAPALTTGTWSVRAQYVAPYVTATMQVGQITIERF